MDFIMKSKWLRRVDRFSSPDHGTIVFQRYFTSSEFSSRFMGEIRDCMNVVEVTLEFEVSIFPVCIALRYSNPTQGADTLESCCNCLFLRLLYLMHLLLVLFKMLKLRKTFAKKLAEPEPLRVVFRDSGFKNDDVRINVEQIFKLMSSQTEVKTI